MRKLRFMIKTAELREFVFACTKDEAQQLAFLKYPKVSFELFRYRI